MLFSLTRCLLRRPPLLLHILRNTSRPRRTVPFIPAGTPRPSAAPPGEETETGPGTQAGTGIEGGTKTRRRRSTSGGPGLDPGPGPGPSPADTHCPAPTGGPTSPGKGSGDLGGAGGGGGAFFIDLHLHLFVQVSLPGEEGPQRLPFREEARGAGAPPSQQQQQLCSAAGAIHIQVSPPGVCTHSRPALNPRNVDVCLIFLLLPWKPQLVFYPLRAFQTRLHHQINPIITSDGSCSG